MPEKYDVAIIGAGIGGLVCGCYLAKAGLKVIIVEQHNKPGGYCTSFERQGYRFDVGVHYLGRIRGGTFGRILEELNIRDLIKFNRVNPTDKIIMPHHMVYIKTNIKETIGQFQKAFPNEKKNINRFFDFILISDFLSVYSKTRKLNFQDLLNSFFKDQKLMSTLEILLGNIGLSAHKTSAVSAILLFREFIVDRGWYPQGGVQVFPNTLLNVITKNGGEVIFSKKVVKILVKNNIAKGMRLEDGKNIYSDMMVSNADVTETFKKLLDIKTKEKGGLNELQISPSFFCVYLGFTEDFRKIMKEQSTTLWNFSTYNIRSCYDRIDKIVSPRNKLQYLVSVFPFMHDGNYNMPTMETFMAAPFKTVNFWEKHREYLMEKVISKAEETIPNLNKYIKIKVNATPHTFHRYTSNRNGAVYGWASAPYLIRHSMFPTKTTVKNLFLAGHWVTGGLSQGGISQVAVMGRKAAQTIILEKGLKWQYKHSVLL